MSPVIAIGAAVPLAGDVRHEADTPRDAAAPRAGGGRDAARREARDAAGGSDAPHGVVVALQEVLRAQLAALGAPLPPDGALAMPDGLLRWLLRAYQDASPEVRAAISADVVRAARMLRAAGGTVTALVIDGTA